MGGHPPIGQLRGQRRRQGGAAGAKRRVPRGMKAGFCLRAFGQAGCHRLARRPGVLAVCVCTSAVYEARLWQ
eukprot:3497905-Alexandrium_andersonii.AAC.1